LGVHPNHALYVGDSTIDFDTSRNASVNFRLFSQGYLNGSLAGFATKDIFDDWADHGILF
jgi:phosphoglycolate phosphatase-like HAD superfamily hydrolase